MASIVQFTTPQFERDLLISSFAPLFWLALVQARLIDEGHPNRVAVRWLTDLATAVGPLLSDCDAEAVRLARLYTEDAVSHMRQTPLQSGKAS